MEEYQVTEDEEYQVTEDANAKLNGKDIKVLGPSKVLIVSIVISGGPVLKVPT